MNIKELKELFDGAKPTCCDKPMKFDARPDMLSDQNMSGWTCLKCRQFLTLIEGQLDEKELGELE